MRPNPIKPIFRGMVAVLTIGLLAHKTIVRCFRAEEIVADSIENGARVGQAVVRPCLKGRIVEESACVSPAPAEAAAALELGGGISAPGSVSAFMDSMR